MMFGDVAEKLIEMMGHSGTVPGAIAAKDVPEVLERLKNNIASHENDSPENNLEDDDDEKDKVKLSGRAFPLIEMLAKAVNEDAGIRWYSQ